MTDATMLEKNVPVELKSLNQWVLWKRGKVPFTCEDKPASPTNKNDYSSFEDVVSEYVFSARTRGVLGVGFVFVADGGLVGIDLDHAIDERGIKPWALKILGLFDDAYIEYSPSKKGFHIIVKGKKPGLKCKRIINTKQGERIGEIEMYETGRYFTVTGELYMPRYNQLVDGQEQIDLIYEKVLGGDSKQEKVEEKTPEGCLGAPEGTITIGCRDVVSIGTTLPDVLSVIRGSSQATKFKALTEGSLESALAPYGGDHSRAVYGLCALVAFYTSDFSIMDSIFCGSPLNGGKWGEGKWARLGKTQFDRVRNEYEVKKNVYSETKRTAPSEEFTDEEIERAKVDGAAEYDRHIELLWMSHSDARRDILSEALFLKEKDSKKWVAASNRATLSALRGECQMRGKLYKKAKLEDYIYHYGQSLQPQLLIDIPAWDGEDRIGAMCKRVRTKDVDVLVFEDMFRDWCAKMWGKILNPSKVQNRCVILSGKQGVGKDYWVKSMFCGLEKYLSDLTLNGTQTKESDIAVVMAGSLVMFISEFDKTKVIGVETLKELVTKERFEFVRKYDRESSNLTNRCSIIAACNPEHVLRDVTGNRRFLVFKLEGGPGEAIQWTYPFMDTAFSLQVISQCRELWQSGYSASTTSERIMAELTRAYTPDDANEEIVMDFESMIESRMAGDCLDVSGGLFKVETLGIELDTLARNHGTSRRNILCVLKGAGNQWRNSKGRYYGSRETILKLDSGELNANQVVEKPVDYATKKRVFD